MTKLLYLQNPEMVKFQAKVFKINQIETGFLEIILDQTIFYSQN